MQPTPIQRLFTDNRPLYFLMAVGAVAMLSWAASILGPTLSLSIWHITQFIFLMLVAGALGAVLGACPGGMVVLSLLYRWVEHRNGAPFQSGDTVIILSRRFPGRVTRIYEVWPERHDERVCRSQA